MLPLDSVTLLATARTFREILRVPVALSRQFQVRRGSISALLLKCVQDVHRVLELGDIDHPERPSLISHAYLARARPNGGHRLKVIGIASELHHEQFMTCPDAPRARDVTCNRSGEGASTP